MCSGIHGYVCRCIIEAGGRHAVSYSITLHLLSIIVAVIKTEAHCFAWTGWPSSLRDPLRPLSPVERLHRQLHTAALCFLIWSTMIYSGAHEICGLKHLANPHLALLPFCWRASMFLLTLGIPAAFACYFL